MEDNINIKTLSFCDWKHYSDTSDSDVRIYFKEDSNIGSGFNFYAVQRISHVNEDWNFETYVEVIYNGHANWEGVRHLYMGAEETNNYGYDYYPNIEMHISILKMLQELEDKFCKEKFN